jgi:DNA modification methylase
MKIEMWPVDRPSEYEKNPRRNDGAVEAVAASIREFGFRSPIIVDEDGVIIAGHTRLKAARSLGLDEVPVHVAAGLTPDQARALRLADNRTAEIADWDPDLLPVELADLKLAGFDMEVLGWSQSEIDELLAPPPTDGLVDEDEVPEVPAEATTRRGDVWVLGEHRLMCGDSGSESDLDLLLDGGRVSLVNTDPPYNVKVEPRSSRAIDAGLSSFGDGKKKGKAALRARDRPLINDFVTDEAFDELLAAWFGNIARVLKPGGSFYIWGGYANCGNYPPVLARLGLYFAQAIIWVKEHPVITRKDFMGNHEWCFYGWREGAAHRFFGPKNITDVWSVKKIAPQAMVHLTEKPVELARRAIEYSSKPGEVVLDLFGGSGSTLIAAEQTGRRACLMELDPLYCDVIVERWEKFTGKKAERIGAGETEPAEIGGAA